MLVSFEAYSDSFESLASVLKSSLSALGNVIVLVIAKVVYSLESSSSKLYGSTPLTVFVATAGRAEVVVTANIV